MTRRILIFLIAFVFPVVGALAWWGVFARPTIGETVAGPYIYAYLDYAGRLSNMGDQQEVAYRHAQVQNLDASRAITVLLTDPRQASDQRVEAQVGFIVAPDTAVKPPLKRGVIARRAVITATLRAHPMVAPGKAYSALIEYLTQNRMPLRLPTVERYEHSVFVLEMPAEGSLQRR